MSSYWDNRSLSRRRVLAGGAVVSAAGIAVGIVGCGDDSSGGTTPSATFGSQGKNTTTASSPTVAAPTGELTIAISALPPTLDPHRTSGGGYFPFNWETFDGLLQRDGQGKIVPGLAKSYEYNADFTELTLKLRDGVKFHNGDAFTSEDVAFSLDRLRTPAFKMAYAANFARIASVQTPDPLTVTFKSSKPFPELHQYLDSYFYVVPKAYAASAGDSFSTKPVGTGAYKVTGFTADNVIEFEANAQYWNYTPGTQKVHLKALAEPSTRVAALQSGDASLIWDIPPQFFEQLKGDSKLSLVFSPAARVQFIMMNLRGQGNKAYTDPRVREALNISINRDQIGKVVYGGSAVGGGWFAPKGVTGHKDAAPYPYDPQRAKDQLAAAGFANGLEIDPLIYAASASTEPMFNGIIADWAKVGIKSKNNGLGADFIDSLLSHKAPLLATTSQNVSFDGAADLIRWLRSDGGYSISDGSLDADIDKASAAGGNDREKALEGVFQKVYDSYMVIPIVENGNVYAFRKDRIKDWPQILGWPYPRGYGRIVKA